MTRPRRDPSLARAAAEVGHPTIEAVAAVAGVSKTTVSHVMSGNRPVAAATQERVQRVIDELQFRPSAVARSLKSSRSHTVALMVPDVTNPFYPSLARGLQDAVRSAGYLALLADSRGDADQERGFIAEALERRVDGLVLASFALTAADLQPAMRAGLAVVSVGPQLADSGVDVVTADDQEIGADAVQSLADRGHTRIACITGPAATQPGRGRREGGLRRLAALGLGGEEELVVEADFTREGGRAAAERLLALVAPPTAVFCANDLMAFGALDAARAAGVPVPDALAVVGVDDIDAASLTSPQLSSVHVGAEEMGHTAGRMLLERITGETTAPARTVLVAHKLIHRQTA